MLIERRMDNKVNCRRIRALNNTFRIGFLVEDIHLSLISLLSDLLDVTGLGINTVEY